MCWLLPFLSFSFSSSSPSPSISSPLLILSCLLLLAQWFLYGKVTSYLNSTMECLNSSINSFMAVAGQITTLTPAGTTVLIIAIVAAMVVHWCCWPSHSGMYPCIWQASIMIPVTSMLADRTIALARNCCGHWPIVPLVWDRVPAIPVLYSTMDAQNSTAMGVASMVNLARNTNPGCAVLTAATMTTMVVLLDYTPVGWILAIGW